MWRTITPSTLSVDPLVDCPSPRRTSRRLTATSPSASTNPGEDRERSERDHLACAAGGLKRERGRAFVRMLRVPPHARPLSGYRDSGLLLVTIEKMSLPIPEWRKQRSRGRYYANRGKKWWIEYTKVKYQHCGKLSGN